MARDQVMEPGHPLDPLRQPTTAKTAPIGIHHEHVMMSLGPIMTNKHFHLIGLRLTSPRRVRLEMNQVWLSSP